MTTKPRVPTRKSQISKVQKRAERTKEAVKYLLENPLLSNLEINRLDSQPKTALKNMFTHFEQGEIEKDIEDLNRRNFYSEGPEFDLKKDKMLFQAKYPDMSFQELSKSLGLK